MDNLSPVKTHDLGHGWELKLAHFNGEDDETATIRNVAKGERIDLSAESLARLRDILAKANA